MAYRYIGFSGPGGCGKTTLVNYLKPWIIKNNPEVEIIPSISRELVELTGMKLIEHGNDTTQILIMGGFCEKMMMYPNALFERTPIDCLAYTVYQYAQGTTSSNVLNHVTAVAEKLIDKFDHIFYIPLEFDVEDDGVRSQDKKFNKDTSRIFENLIKIYQKRGNNIHRLGGSVEERAEKFKEIMKEQG